MSDHADTIRAIAEREPKAVILTEPANERYNNYVLLTVEERSALLAERQQLREALERITRWDYSECAVNNPVLIARAALAGEDTPGTQRERAVRDYRRRLVWSAFTHPHLVLYRAWIWCHAKSWRSLRWPLFYVIDPRPLDPVALRGLQRLTKEHLER